MESENRKSRIVLTVVGAATLLTALVGATFAWFSATSTTATQQVTTSSLNLTVAANGDATHVSEIKPTAWSATMSENESNADIAKIPFKVTGTSSTNGTYTINMQTGITLNAGTVVEEQGKDPVALTGGSAADIKYRLYKDGAQVGVEGSFSETTNVNIVTDGAITADVALNDEYVLYVYIQNKDEAQNKLQNVDFTITLGGSATQAQ